MKKLITILFVALGASLNAIAGGRIVTDSIESKILGYDVKYNVYLPEGFGKEDCLYPVVYLLHGLSDDYTAWQEKGRMKEVADELISSGEARKMVIIMPNAGGKDTRNIQCGYFNMPGCNYEDFFFQEFIPAVENKYRCYGDKGHRAVMGLSMGGGGSTVYCQRHPDMFSSCYAMSAWLEEEEVNPANAPKDKLYIVRESVHEHSALAFIDNASPDTIKDLKTVKWFFDCGDDDSLLRLSYELYVKMKAAGIKAELRVRDGVHNWEYWHCAIRTALPFASRSFVF